MSRLGGREPGDCRGGGNYIVAELNRQWAGSATGSCQQMGWRRKGFPWKWRRLAGAHLLTQRAPCYLNSRVRHGEFRLNIDARRNVARLGVDTLSRLEVHFHFVATLAVHIEGATATRTDLKVVQLDGLSGDRYEGSRKRLSRIVDQRDFGGMPSAAREQQSGHHQECKGSHVDSATRA